jgi:hypothetical protein
MASEKKKAMKNSGLSSKEFRKGMKHAKISDRSMKKSVLKDKTAGYRFR